MGDLRLRFDAAARLGAPAHITVLFPFMPPSLITEAVLGQVQVALDEVFVFAFRLHAVARFPATTFLAPEPVAPFVALTAALSRAFPAYPPFQGEHATVVPHLTVAHGDAAEVELAAAELERLMQAQGPIDSVCSHVTLLESASGAWREMHAFALPRR